MAGEKKKRKPGRPTKYKPEFAEQAYGMCLLKGMTDEELANYFGVATSSIYEWKKEHPDFSEAIKKGKEIADVSVATALRDRALGYSHPEDKIFLHEGEPVIVPTTKHYPPDTAAAFIWLKNRHPERWRDKVEVEHGGQVEFEILLPEGMKKGNGSTA